MKALEIQIVQELSGRYLKINAEGNTENFGAEMLEYNEVEGVIGAEIYRVDNTDWYLYSVHDWMSLSELFETNRLTAGELSAILEQLEEIAQRCQEFFLDEKNLLLVCDNMFYDEKKKSLKILYLDGYGEKAADGISKLLERFMDTMNQSDRELVFLVYGLHRISRDKNFSLGKLIDFLREQKRSCREKIPLHEQKEYEEKSAAVSEPEYSLPSQPSERKQHMDKSFIKYIKAAAFGIAGIFLFFLLLKMGLLNHPVSGGTDVRKAAVLAAVLLVAEGYFWEKILGAKETERMIQKEEMEDKTTLLVSTYSDDTVVLDSAPDSKWYVNLVPKDWQRREIKVRKSPFFIGKDAGRVDGIIHECDVSRIHAKIVADEDGVFLIDQESTNGTFVNGIRIVPWERRKIESGDMIGVSSIYYKAELYQ